MFKKFAIVTLLLMMIILPNVYAQDETTFTVPSGRYSLTYPSNYVITEKSIIEGFQELFPNDSIAIADSEETIAFAQSDDFDPFESTDQEFKGLVVISTSWPAGLLTSIGMTPESMGEQFTSGAVEEGFELTEIAVELEGSSGTRYLLTSAESSNQVMLQLTLDAGGNLYFQIVVAGMDHAAAAQSILDSLTVHEFDQEVLLQPETFDVPVEILADELEVDVPAGWWVMASGGNVMTIPVIDPVFFQSLSNRDEIMQGSGSVLMGYTSEKSMLPEEVYNADGTLNPEGLVSMMNEGMNLGVEVEGLENLEITEWTSEAGLTGVSFVLDMTEQRGVYMIMFVYDSGENLSMLAGIITPDQWEQMRPIFEAISQTMRPVEAGE